MLINQRSPVSIPITPLSLNRCLRTVGVLFLALSVATPASSVFIIVPGILQVAGSGALWALLIAGVVCVATAFIYAELSSAWPVAGGEYVMVARTLGPAAGFAMLGVNVFNNLLFPPVAALGVAAVANVVLPGLPTVPVAIAVIAAATLMGIFNVQVNALVTGSFLAVETIALGLVTALGATHPMRALGGMLARPLVPNAAAHGAALVPVSAAAIGVAAVIAIFALNGYGAAVYFGEEMHEAPRRIARAIFLALVATLVLEVLPVVAGLVGTPDLAGFLASDNPFGNFVVARAGQRVAGIVAYGVVLAIINAVLAGILSAARFLYATARDRSWGRPLDVWLDTIHPRFASPVGATVLSGGIGMAACLVPLQLLLVLSGSGLIVIYAGVTAAVVAGRRSGKTLHACYRMPLYPAAPIVAGLALAGVAWLNWLDPSEGRPALFATAAQIALSFAYYWIALRRRQWRGFSE